MAAILDCPESGPAQLNFRLFGTPVRVHFWFWLAMLMIGGRRGPLEAAVWVAVCFVSIPLHEMGHVAAFRFFGHRAEVVLYGCGGLAIPFGEVVGTLPRVWVALARPVAGFCLAALTMAAVGLTGGSYLFGWGFPPYLIAMPNPILVLGPHGTQTYYFVSVVADDFLFVNFAWGLINLLPVWPLDGGHISRALERWDRSDGLRKSLILSAAASVSIALANFANNDQYLGFMFGLLAVSSFQSLAAFQRRAIPVFRRYRD